MSKDTITLALQERSTVRKGLAALRKDGQVPAVIHDHGKESMHVMGDFISINKVYLQAGKHHPVEIELDGKQHLALIKDVDYEPTKHRLRHVVFQAIRQNEKTTAEIPVVMVGDEIPAERKSLLILQQLDVVEVEALPKNLPDQLTVDATVLSEVGDRLTVADIKAPEGVTILTEADHSIAVVEMPKDQIAEADASALSLAEDAGVPDAEVAEPQAVTDADAEKSAE